MTEEVRRWLARVSDPRSFPWPLEAVEEGVSEDGLPLDPFHDFERKAGSYLLREHSYKGGKDELGRFHGGGTIEFKVTDVNVDKILTGAFSHV